jgi:hypothetical protein
MTIESDAKAASGPPATSSLTARSPVGPALLSALLPGLGQATQRRTGAALAQFLTVATYLAVVWGAGSPRAAILAIAWNLWSMIDAYRHERD